MSVQKTATDIKGLQILFVKAQVKPGLLILIVLASAFYDSASVNGGFVDEDWGKIDIEYLSLLHILGNQVISFSSYIFSSFPFITNVPIEAFLAALHVPGQI